MSKIVAIILSGVVLCSAIPVNAVEYKSRELMIEYQDGIRGLVDGVYIVPVESMHIDKDQESMASNYVSKEGIIEVSKGKIFLTIEFINKKMMSDCKISVNGEVVNHEIAKEEENSISYKVELKSLTDSITVAAKINIFGGMNVEFRAILDTTTIPSDDTDDEDSLPPVELPDEKPEVEPKPEPTPEVTPKPEPDVSTDEELNQNIDLSKNGTYKIKNKVISDSAIGYQAARDALNEVSYIEVVDGKKYITLGFGQTDLMSNIRIKQGGNTISYEVVRRNDSTATMDIKFSIPDISENITIQSFINMIERDISFDVDFLDSTLEVISLDEINKPLGTQSTNKVTTQTLSVDAGESTEETAVQSIEAKEYFKKYSIENEIISDSTMGKTMARKYTESLSILEEIDGQLFLTLQFTGTDSMDNFKFEVNGQAVEYTLASSGGGSKSFRFPISSINDDIKVYIFIKPVKMNIDFGVKLLEESMVLLEEGIIGEEGGSNSNSTELILQEIRKIKDSQPSTIKIALISSAMTTAFLSSIAGALYIIKKRKSKKQ
ncbi:MAG: NEAT domain-containing protein [Clostridium sp.]